MKVKSDQGLIDLIGLYGKTGEDRSLVFEFHGDIGRVEELASLVEDCCQLSGLDAMIVIVSHPDLQNTEIFRVVFASAIEKSFGNGSDFSDVKVWRSLFSVRQGESDAMIGV
jgi:hypothetical protein